MKVVNCVTRTRMECPVGHGIRHGYFSILPIFYTKVKYPSEVSNFWTRCRTRILQGKVKSPSNTDHQSLRGPRGGMIFFKKDRVLGVDLESAVNNAVFPGLQGGPYNHTIGGLAVCLKYARSPEFKAYQKQVVSNCRSLASKLIAQGHELVSDGSCESLAI